MGDPTTERVLEQRLHGRERGPRVEDPASSDHRVVLDRAGAEVPERHRDGPQLGCRWGHRHGCDEHAELRCRGEVHVPVVDLEPRPDPLADDGRARAGLRQAVVEQVGVGRPRQALLDVGADLLQAAQREQPWFRQDPPHRLVQHRPMLPDRGSSRPDGRDHSSQATA
jgi:hypothetical protein